MRLAISNIAWPTNQDDVVASLLRDEGVEGIEIAPTKWWPNPLEATQAEILERRKYWNDRGLSIVAAQSLLFGKVELQLFGTKEIRKELRDYLCGLIELCAALGAGPLVFGSPKNRKRGDISVNDANHIAVDFFGSLAEFAHDRGTCLSLEENPPYYGADFMTTVAETLEVVRAIDHPGIQLQIDTACMSYVNDDPVTKFELAKSCIAHFHVSEPNLVEVGTGDVDHESFAVAIHRTKYSKWFSIEMRESSPFDIEGLRRAIRSTKQCYSQTTR